MELYRFFQIPKASIWSKTVLDMLQNWHRNQSDTSSLPCRFLHHRNTACNFPLGSDVRTFFRRQVPYCSTLYRYSSTNSPFESSKSRNLTRIMMTSTLIQISTLSLKLKLVPPRDSAEPDSQYAVSFGSATGYSWNYGNLPLAKEVCGSQKKLWVNS